MESVNKIGNVQVHKKFVKSCDNEQKNENKK